MQPQSVQSGRAQVAGLLESTSGYAIRDATLTVIGLCGLPREQLPDLLPELLDESGARTSTIGVSMSGDADSDSFEVTLIYPASGGSQLEIADQANRWSIDFADDPAPSDCLRVESEAITRLECGLATLYEWTTDLEWDPEDPLIGVGVETVEGAEVAGLSLATATSSTVRDGRLVIRLAMIGEDFGPVSGRTELALIDVYSQRRGRTVLPTTRSGQFRVG